MDEKLTKLAEMEKMERTMHADVVALRKEVKAEQFKLKIFHLSTLQCDFLADTARKKGVHQVDVLRELIDREMKRQARFNLNSNGE